MLYAYNYNHGYCYTVLSSIYVYSLFSYSYSELESRTYFLCTKLVGKKLTLVIPRMIIDSFSLLGPWD